MPDRDSTPSAVAQHAAPAQQAQVVERERAQMFSKALRILLQRQSYFVPLTGTYLLPQFYERVRVVDGHGIHINTLRAYLRGETLPSDSKVRILADALGVPRGVLLYAAGYLTPEDLPNYPGPYATLATIEADIREVEALPLSPQTKARVLHDLRTSARILHLLAAEHAQAGYATAPDERERLIEMLIELWETPAPPPPVVTSSEETRRQTPPPARQGSAASQPVPVARQAVHQTARPGQSER